MEEDGESGFESIAYIFSEILERNDFSLHFWTFFPMLCLTFTIVVVFLDSLVLSSDQSGVPRLLFIAPKIWLLISFASTILVSAIHGKDFLLSWSVLMHLPVLIGLGVMVTKLTQTTPPPEQPRAKTE